MHSDVAEVGLFVSSISQAGSVKKTFQETNSPIDTPRTIPIQMALRTYSDVGEGYRGV